MWVCDDGYVHQVLLNLVSADKEQPGQVMDFSMRLHLFDFERQDIAITAPANAVPLTAPHREKPTTPPAQGRAQP